MVVAEIINIVYRVSPAGARGGLTLVEYLLGVLLVSLVAVLLVLALCAVLSAPALADRNDDDADDDDDDEDGPAQALRVLVSSSQLSLEPEKRFDSICEVNRCTPWPST